MSNSLRPYGLNSPPRLLCPWNFPCKNTGVGSHSFLQGIFPTQGSNPALLHCRQILYHQSHQGSPWILEWVAYPFSRGIFLTKESNWGLLHWRRILNQLSYQGSAKLINWVCMLSCSVILWTVRLLCPWGFSIKNTGVGCHALLHGVFPTQGLKPGLPIAGRFFTVWATREAHEYWNG